jgi:membrane protein DedA with SNARE-associated domain
MAGSSMTFANFAQDVIDFVRVHQVWGPPIVFALAFGESLAFISLFIPAWAILVGIGAIIHASGIPFWPFLVAAALGAAAGDWLSYWIGITFKEPIAHVWPLSKYPDLLPRGHAFMEHWGILGIFIGRFFGPLRASVPLIAGILEMPYWYFQFANITSAFVWAWVLLIFGDFGFGIFKWFT